MNRRRFIALSSFVVIIALSGCLNSITLDAGNLDDGSADGEAALDGPETVVSAAPGSDTRLSVDRTTETSAASSVESAESDDGVSPTAPVINAGSGDPIEGFALDELEISRHLEQEVNQFRTKERKAYMSRHEFLDSSSLRASARYHAKRLAKNTLLLYSDALSDNVKSRVLQSLSAAPEEQRELRFIKHNAAECNANIASFNYEEETMEPATAEITTSGEVVTTVTYSELADRLSAGDGAGNAEGRIAAAVFEKVKEDGHARDYMKEGSFKYQGVGIKNVPSERVMVVVQDFC